MTLVVWTVVRPPAISVPPNVVTSPVGRTSIDERTRRPGIGVRGGSGATAGHRGRLELQSERTAGRRGTRSLADSVADVVSEGHTSFGRNLDRGRSGSLDQDRDECWVPSERSQRALLWGRRRRLRTRRDTGRQLLSVLSLWPTTTDLRPSVIARANTPK